MKVGKEFLRSKKALNVGDKWFYFSDGGYILVEISNVEGITAHNNFCDVKNVETGKGAVADIYKLSEAIEENTISDVVRNKKGNIRKFVNERPMEDAE